VKNINAPGAAEMRWTMPNRIDKISACSLGTPKMPRKKTINPSRTPQPAKEIGIADRIVISGITNKKILESIVMPISLAKIDAEYTYKTVMDSVMNMILDIPLNLKRDVPKCINWCSIGIFFVINRFRQ